MDFLEILKAALLGVVQGITEWLPISSTGHMLLLDEFLNWHMSEAFKEMFFVVVQLGSILAVIVLYFEKLNPFSAHKTQKQKKATWHIWLTVVLAAIPGGLIGVLFDDQIDALFYNSTITIAAALIIYGVLFIFLEKRNARAEAKIRRVERIDWKTALLIGCFQVLALIPGTSRSGSTILGAMLVGVARVPAAEFSFFLALPMMLGASGVKLLKFGFSFTTPELVMLAVGTAVAFVVSLLVIRFLMNYIRKRDFTAFGWYRIALGLLILFYFLIVK